MFPWFDDDTLDMKDSTFGSCRRTDAAACWCCTIELNETPSCASVPPMMRPVSSLGKKPFGILTKRTSVSARTTIE